MTAPAVSVIIPAHDAEALLRRSLESVLRSEGVTFEVIVVDDASTDGTATVAREMACRVISVRENIMAANCRNLGASHARGEILVFFDADQLMEPDTLRRYAETLGKHADVDAVVGSLASDTPVPGFFSRFKNFQHHYTHQTADREGSTLASGLMAVRRHVFSELGGFEPAFGGATVEDIALGYRMRRLGHRILFEPSIQIVHLKGYTLRQLIRSDIVLRAIPWTGLMLRERVVRNDLNTRSGNVASVALAWLVPPALVAAVLGWARGSSIASTTAWIASAAAVGLITLLNRRFLAAARGRLGCWFALRAAAFLPVMYLYHGVGLIAGVLAYARGASVARRRDAPEPDYVIHEPEAPRPSG